MAGAGPKPVVVAGPEIFDTEMFNPGKFNPGKLRFRNVKPRIA
jgi:hypothetical protein